MEYRKTASKWMRKYMFDTEVFLKQVECDTGIPVERLEMECEEAFSADEFMTLCAYFEMELAELIMADY